MIPLRDTIRSRHFPIMNWLILGANTAVFVYMLGLRPGELERLVNTFALVPARLDNDPVQFGVTLFSSMFMHGGWFHFLSNMWVLFIFGDNVEDRMGPLSYLTFYLLSGVVAGGLQASVGLNSAIPVIGASGAIAGVLGAYMFLFPGARVLTLVPIFFFGWFVEISAVFFLGFWFITQLYSGLFAFGTTMGGVAWWAHIGGFVFGAVFKGLFITRRPRYSMEAGPFENDLLP